jgi:hypothetical protein
LAERWAPLQAVAAAVATAQFDEMMPPGRPPHLSLAGLRALLQDAATTQDGEIGEKGMGCQGCLDGEIVSLWMMMMKTTTTRMRMKMRMRMRMRTRIGTQQLHFRGRGLRRRKRCVMQTVVLVQGKRRMRRLDMRKRTGRALLVRLSTMARCVSVKCAARSSL